MRTVPRIAPPVLAAPARAEDRSAALTAAETHRIAIGADGRRVREARRVTAPGYTFPHPWPDALLPPAAARDGHPCPWPNEQESARP